MHRKVGTEPYTDLTHAYTHGTRHASHTEHTNT